MPGVTSPGVSWRNAHQSQMADGDRLGTEAVAMSRMGDGDQRLGALT
jgi:hypothetical protein